MYAIVQIGSSQVRVSEGDVIESNRLKAEEGKDITLDKVLLVADKKDVKVGQPFLKDAKVVAKVTKHDKGEKLVAYKYRIRKNSTSKTGHRQALTTLTIAKISA